MGCQNKYWLFFFLRVAYLLCFFQFYVSFCYGQYFDDSRRSFQNLNLEDGLSANTVNCIFRDENGFVWLGTRNGLNRFDGESVKVIDKQVSENINLNDQQIYDLFGDSAGILWIAAGRGLFRYDWKYEKTDHFFFSGDLSVEPSVYCIEPENDSLLWLGTGDGLKLFDKKDGHIITILSRG